MNSGHVKKLAPPPYDTIVAFKDCPRGFDACCSGMDVAAAEEVG